MPQDLAFFTSVRPSYMCRSDPQILVVVSLMMTSVSLSSLDLRRCPRILSLGRDIRVPSWLSLFIRLFVHVIEIDLAYESTEEWPAADLGKDVRLQSIGQMQHFRRQAVGPDLRIQLVLTLVKSAWCWPRIVAAPASGSPFRPLPLLPASAPAVFSGRVRRFMREDVDYLLYSPQVETVAPDEQETFDELSRTMQHITRHMATRYRHAYRPVHAKSHGVLVGTLKVLPNLAPALSQGLFQEASTHPVIMRFSTNPGDLLADNVSSPRGLAIKVLNVDGPKVPNHGSQTTQDFVCINATAFPAPDAKGFLEQMKLFDKTLDTPEGIKHAVSVAARATNAVLKVVHLPSSTLEGIGASATHILGETFSTVAPLRYGDYVAKIEIAPGSDNLKKLTGKGINLNADYNALEELIKEFFREQTGVWDVKVQLALAPVPGRARGKG